MGAPRTIPDDAFEQYVALGPGRTYDQVAAICGASYRGIAQVAQRERWGDRLAEIEERARADVDKRITQKLVETRKRHFDIVEDLAKKALRFVRDFDPESFEEARKAAETAIKLERLLMGDATERTQIDLGVQISVAGFEGPIPLTAEDRARVIDVAAEAVESDEE